MDISGLSGISTSVGHKSFAAVSTMVSRAEPHEQERTVREADHHDVRRHRGHTGRAMGVFRQEMRMALRSHFHARFAAEHAGYAKSQEPAMAGQVADEALGAARQIAERDPVNAAKSLIKFRATIHETASYVRETVGQEDDLSDIDHAVAGIDEGLDSLEKDVANTRASTATVLEVDSRTKQRTSIRIRTQEGDVVKLSLRMAENVSATDVAKSDGQASSTSTEVSVSSRSRLMLRVDGDLNENELAAIRNVFAQAEQIANEFFAGDIAASFDLAKGFEFDPEQLARVKMDFRERQYTSITYAETGSAAPALAATVPLRTESEAPASGASDNEPTHARTPDAVDVPATDDAETIVATEEIAATDGSPDDQAIARPAIEPFALSGFLDSLGAFLRSVTDGFQGSALSGGFKFHYSESFKLELLVAAFNTIAPDDDTAAAVSAASLIIEGVAEDNPEVVS